MGRSSLPDRANVMRWFGEKGDGLMSWLEPQILSKFLTSRFTVGHIPLGNLFVVEFEVVAAILSWIAVVTGTVLFVARTSAGGAGGAD